MPDDILTLPASEWRAMAERIAALTAERDETRRLARVVVEALDATTIAVVGGLNGPEEVTRIVVACCALRAHLATEDADHV